ncbi:MAG TPA: TonB-dependent receptor [Agriterribacter sp.]|nr:TonB-dependent receptor [Agriterribacter sp.]
MKHVKLSLILISTFFWLTTIAQPNVVTVSGTVTGNEGQPLQGVNITVKNSSTGGIITNAAGKFSIQVKIGDRLVFSHVGYKSNEVLVRGAQLSLSVSMELDGGQLSEVVMIGYGSVKRKDLTGSVTSVKASDMVKSTEMSLNGTLQGKAAGVSVVSNEGAPGSDVSIYIRAGSSISAGNEPLYVIDGFPQLGGSNLNINVNDVESVEVLKDASATAIYGSRGANGVIIITTKTGKAGRFSINYDGYYSMQELGIKRKVLNTMQYAELQHYLQTSPRNSETGDSIWYNWPTFKDSIFHDWQDEMYRLAGMFSHNLSFTGGTDNLKMAGSLNVTDQDGIAIGTNYKRYSARLNTIANITKFISNTTNIALTYQDRTGSSLTGGGGLVYSSVKGSPYRPPNMDLNDYLIANGMPPGGTYGRDPLVDLIYPDIKNLGYYASLNSSLSFKLTKDLTLKIAGGMTYNVSESDVFYPSNTSYGAFIGGQARKNNSINLGLINENTLNYNKTLPSGDRIDAVAGYSLQKEIRSFTNTSTQKFAIEALGYNNMGMGSQFFAPRSGKTVSGIESYFGRVQYALRDRYIFTGTIRADGSSKFPLHKWGYFPSGGFAWRAIDEKFMTGVPVISDLKFRVTYGLTGNESIAPYSSYTSYGPNNYPPVESGQLVVGVMPTQLGSDALKWETTIQQNLGIDLGLFNSRIQITADFYVKKSKDLLLKAPLSNYSGFSTVTRNIGDMQVKGMEYNLSTLNLNGKFKWSTDFNIAFNKTKVLKLNEGQDYFYTGNVGRYGDAYGNPYIVKVGHELGSFFGYINDGIVHTQEELSVAPQHNSLVTKQGVRKYKDVSGPDGKPDGKIDINDRTVIGNGNPKFFGGFTNSFSYGSFELSFLFTYSYGNDILNADKALFQQPMSYQGGTLDMFDRWTPRNPQINGQRWDLSFVNEYSYASSFLIEDGSYLRLKNIQLAYNMDKELLKKLPIKSVRVYFTAQNLLTFTHYTGYDPEVNFLNSIITPGADLGAYPRSKVYTFGLNLAF